MRTPILIAVLALAICSACSSKEPGGLAPPNDDDDDNNAMRRECVFDSDCIDAVCNADGQCVPASENNDNNNNDPNNDTTGSNNANNTTATNNQTVVDPVPCEDPGDAERFAQWLGTGIDVAIAPDDDTMEGPSGVVTSGIALADFDGDSDLDVMVSNQGDELVLFTNDGTGQFTDESALSGVAGLTRTTSLSVADFDGDGDPDVIVGRTTGAYILLNDNGAFTDVTSTWGPLAGANEVVSGGSFADFDSDGDLDFYMGTYASNPGVFPDPQPNRLFRNDGDRFIEVTTSPGGTTDAASTLAVAWWDFDGDGDLDLWSANDFGMTTQPNQLWRNDGRDPADPNGWLFTDISAEAGIDVAIFSMSATLGDFDNDGDQDAYVANMANNVLHVVHNGTTTDEAVGRGVASSVLPDPMPRPLQPPLYLALIPEMTEFIANYTNAASGMYSLTSWASIFFDADHDGWQDLFVANGAVLTALTPEATNQPNYLFVSDGDGTFTKRCWATPDVRGSSRGAAVGDLDGDGDLDLLWSDNGVNGDGAVIVGRNDMATGNWLAVELAGVAPNTDAIGAKVTLQAGGLTQTRWIDGGQSYLSVSERVAHFGLGAATSVDSLEVTWPDGTIQQVTVPNINARLEVTQ